MDHHNNRMAELIITEVHLIDHHTTTGWTSLKMA
jgi:hypothetical protein